MAIIYHATPQDCSESVNKLVATGTRFTACISGPMGSGKTTALFEIIRAALGLGICSDDIVAVAPWPAVVQANASTACKWLLPIDAMLRYTALIGSNKRVRPDCVAKSYLADVLAPLNDISDQPTETEARFLESLKPRLIAAIKADHEARLESLDLPRNAYLETVRAYTATYKRRHGLLDKADLIQGDYFVSSRTRLLVMDEIAEDEACVMPRYFPNASVIVATRNPTDAELNLGLPVCLRRPERIDLDSGPVTTVPPPPDDFGSLFIIAPPWRRSAWLYWLLYHGLPAPFWINKWSAAQAGAVLARYGRLSNLPTVKLGNAAHMRGIEAEIVIAESPAMCTEDFREIALTRATRSLFVIGSMQA